MSPQDVPVPRKKDLKAHVLIDNSAQTTLVRDSFGFRLDGLMKLHPIL